MRQKSALENYAFEDVYKILQELSEFKCSMLEMAQALVWDFREIFAVIFLINIMIKKSTFRIAFVNFS